MTWNEKQSNTIWCRWKCAWTHSDLTKSGNLMITWKCFFYRKWPETRNNPTQSGGDESVHEHIQTCRSGNFMITWKCLFFFTENGLKRETIQHNLVEMKVCMNTFRPDQIRKFLTIICISLFLQKMTWNEKQSNTIWWRWKCAWTHLDLYLYRYCICRSKSL
jgi:hypothetical protein